MARAAANAACAWLELPRTSPHAWLELPRTPPHAWLELPNGLKAVAKAHAPVILRLSMPIGVKWRSIPSGIVLFLAATGPLTAPAEALAQPASPRSPAGAAVDATAHLNAARKAEVAKDWVTALAEYQAANAAQKSAPAQAGIAKSFDALKRPLDAFQAYTVLLEEHRKMLSTQARTAAEQRLKELANEIGSVTIAVKEAGATVSVDGSPVGTSPLPAPIRLSAGTHKVRVVKEGYETWEGDFTLAGGASQTVDVPLKASATKGHLMVRAMGEGPARVVIDGVDVGQAPWEGDVDPGSHRIELRRGGLTASRSIEIRSGEKNLTELGFETSRLEVTTSDRKGEIRLDGERMGEGVFAGDVAVGKHKLTVVRDGFEPFEKEIEIVEKHTLAESVTLRPKTSTIVGTSQGAEDDDGGVYGGVHVGALFLPSGTGIETEERCTELGASSCDGPGSAGGTLFGYGGYAWAPFGLELMLGAAYDHTSDKAVFDGTGVGNPLVAGVPREESFSVHRVGGLVALRARLSAQTKLLRGSFAAGFGLSYKALFFVREAQATGRDLRDKFSDDDVSYVSPALTFEPSIALRVTDSMAIVLGALLWFETAGQDARTAPETNRFLVGSDTPVPLATPTYRAASGPQTFIGPFLGVQFGP